MDRSISALRRLKIWQSTHNAIIVKHFEECQLRAQRGVRGYIPLLSFFDRPTEIKSLVITVVLESLIFINYY